MLKHAAHTRTTVQIRYDRVQPLNQEVQADAM